MNWNKFKTMSIFQKAQWVIQYYGVTIVVILAMLIVGTVFVKAVFGPQNHYAVRIMILDDHLSSDTCNRLRSDLSNVLVGECDITSYMERDMNQKQAFTIRLSADELDVVIAPKKEMEKMWQNGYLKRIEAIKEDSFYYSVTREGDIQSDSQMYVGVTVKSDNIGNVDAVLSYIQTRK